MWLSYPEVWFLLVGCMGEFGAGPGGALYFDLGGRGGGLMLTPERSC